MNYNSTQNISSFKRNIAITYALAIPMLITMAALMTVFAYWKNEYLIMLVFMIAGYLTTTMAYRQRKLEYWTFERRQTLFIFGVFLSVLPPMTFIMLGLFFSPYIGLIATLALATYLSLSNLAIFLLAYRMKVPTAKHLAEVVAREAKRSNFLMYAFFGVPLFISFLVYLFS